MLKLFKFWGKFALAVFMAIGAITLVTYEEHKASDKYQRNCQSHTAQVAPGSANQQTGTNECQDPKQYMPWWYALIAWPDGITSWALLATLVAIIWQSNETRRSANATADSANAAYGSVTYAEAQWKLVIEKERARLDIKWGDSLTVETLIGLWGINATVKLRNIGASRAFITRSGGLLVIREVDGAPLRELQEIESLILPDQFLDPSNTPIDVQMAAFPEVMSPQPKIGEIADDLYGGSKRIQLYGFIEYDTLGMRLRKDFGYIWKVFDNLHSLAGMLGIPAPSTDEERITSGHWVVDPEMDRPEYTVTSES